MVVFFKYLNCLRLGKVLVLSVLQVEEDGEEEEAEEYHFIATAYKMSKLPCMVCILH